jgi:predicted nucleic acid-binding protein
MRLVVDANVIFSSIIKDSITRKLILFEDLRLFTPEYFYIELEKHIDIIQEKSKLNRNIVELLIDVIMSNIDVVPLDEYVKFVPEAYKIMKDIDEYDTAFLALAMSLKVDGIWSNDPDLSKQSKIKTYTTKELIEKFNL